MPLEEHSSLATSRFLDKNYLKSEKNETFYQYSIYTQLYACQPAYNLEGLSPRDSQVFVIDSVLKMKI